MNRAVGKLVSGCVAAVSAGAILLGSAGPSAAYGKNGNLEGDEFGLYYLTGQSGCVFDLYTTDTNFADDTFKPTCNGMYKGVNDNTESYWNRDVYAWKVGTDKDLDGNVGEIPSRYAGNASATFRNRISSAAYTLHS
ncbi:hypothetical protein ACIGFK_39985 [Streptomyces sp. NPDC085524]|uniref:hypothetical protein n=1 Tax=unclassified Streptomyces TaxID=2593676 RepID=UPI0035D62BC8